MFSSRFDPAASALTSQQALDDLTSRLLQIQTGIQVTVALKVAVVTVKHPL